GDLLFRPEEVAERTGSTLGQINYEAHSRFAQALMCVVAAVVGFAALLVGTYSRFGVWWQIVAAFTLLVMIKMIEGGVSGAVLARASAWPLMYLPTLTGAVATLILLAIAARPGLMVRLWQRLRPGSPDASGDAA
ncbi:MAG: LPS export ABC transporter permease LptF, partial [Pseudomonadota bacterium]